MWTNRRDEHHVKQQVAYRATRFCQLPSIVELSRHECATNSTPWLGMQVRRPEIWIARRQARTTEILAVPTRHFFVFRVRVSADKWFPNGAAGRWPPVH